MTVDARNIKLNRRRVATLRRRLKFLRAHLKTADPSFAGTAYDEAEASALEWAIALLIEVMINGDSPNGGAERNT